MAASLPTASQRDLTRDKTRSGEGPTGSRALLTFLTDLTQYASIHRTSALWSLAQNYTQLALTP